MRALVAAAPTLVGMTDHLRYLEDSPPPARTRRHADLWSRARQDYLAGGSASEVCERHGLSVSTFRWRARNEGWRRSDQPDSAPDEPFADDGRWDASFGDAYIGEAHPGEDLASDGQVWLHPADTAPTPLPLETPATAAELKERAWANAAQAIRRGRMIEARGWTRLHRELEKMVQDQEARARFAARQAARDAEPAGPSAIDTALNELNTAMAALR